MTDIPETVKTKLQEIRNAGDTEFAHMAETVVKYYVDKIDEFEAEPCYIIDALEELLSDVNEGLGLNGNDDGED